MDGTRLPKILIGVALVASALGYLIYSASRANLVYYYEIDEARAAVLPDQQVRLAGDVVAGTIRKTQEHSRIEFAIEDPTRRHRVPVTYAGAVPDIFKPGIQVVVEGRFDRGGTFAADRLTAKCPSKYQEAGELGSSPAPRAKPAAS
ncbi:MAG: cytochrome c maturation protein CcmE [Gemmatimonadetes bacterium]|nr:cytochrome c maturation protein CcmE [Gemmatimonadota bacterium]